ncbi:MAG: general secretion pathway protein GspB [Pseudomonadota bacterium]
MSYILDALRKADAQRARDPVHGIHAQPLRSSADLSSQASLRPWHIGAGLGVAAAISVAAWFLMSGGDKDTGRDKAESVASGPTSTRAGVQAPAALPLPPPALQAPAAMPPAVAPTAQSASPPPVVGTTIQPPPSTLPPPAPPTESQLAAAMPPSWPQASEDPRSPRNTRPGRRFGEGMAEGMAPQAQAQAQAAAAPLVPPPGPPVAPAAIASPPVATTSIGAPITGMAVPPAASMAPATPVSRGMPQVMQPIQPVPGARSVPATTAAAVTAPAVGLPPDAPRLAINGGVYSSSKAQRMLIVNGQVYNEGNEIAAGVVLEEIRNKTAVVRFRGSRYTVEY